MKVIAVLVMVAACSSKPADYAPTKNERTNYGTYWCPDRGTATLGTTSLLCTPVLQVAPKGMRGQAVREFIAAAPLYSVEPCMKKANIAGGTCTMTRLVVCNTHDANESNVCFLTWDMCKQDAAEHPGRECAAYFDGERLRD
jgi:hypothetical protein